MVQGWCRGAGPLTETGTFQKPGLPATRGHPSGCFGSLCLTASASSWIREKDVWPREASSRFDAPPSNGISSPLGRSVWEWQRVPAPPTAQVQSQVAAEVARRARVPPPLPRPNYKLSFSRGSSMLKEYQLIQNTRLKARISAPV